MDEKIYDLGKGRSALSVLLGLLLVGAIWPQPHTTVYAADVCETKSWSVEIYDFSGNHEKFDGSATSYSDGSIVVLIAYEIVEIDYVKLEISALEKDSREIIWDVDFQNVEKLQEDPDVFFQPTYTGEEPNVQGFNVWDLNAYSSEEWEMWRIPYEPRPDFDSSMVAEINTRILFPVGSYTLTYLHFTDCSGGGGSPHLGVWTGESYEIENNLLPRADSPNVNYDIDDYYAIQTSPAPKSGTYSFEVVEFEEARNFFDQFRLIVVDHSNSVRVGVTEEGRLLTYEDPQPPRGAFNQDGENIKSLVMFPDDGKWYEGRIGDYAVFDFGHLRGDMYKLVIRADQEQKESLLIQVDTGDEWNTVASLFPRKNWYTDTVDLTDFFQDSESVRVRIVWTDFHILDFIGIDTSDNESVRVSVVVPSYVHHSTDGDVTLLLQANDGERVEVEPGEFITLQFEMPETLDDVRTLVLHVNGYYEKA